MKQVGERIAIFREECEKTGRAFNPAMVGVTRALQMFFDEAERKAAIETRKRVVGVIGDLAKGERPKSIEEDDAPLLGTPAEIIARLRALEAVGAGFILMSDPLGSAATLRAFAQHIMPAFAEPKMMAAE